MSLDFALSPIDPVSVFVIVVAGVLTGAVILWQLPTIRRSALSWQLTCFTILMLGIVFFTARFGGYIYSGNNLASRNLGFGILWAIYTVAIMAGLAARRRWS